MKLYTFINSYVSGIQVGIQASHSIVEFMGKSKSPLLGRWFDHHKTFAWLDGGPNVAMNTSYELFKAAGLEPIKFEEPGMAGLLTAFSLILHPTLQREVDWVKSGDVVHNGGNTYIDRASGEVKVLQYDFEVIKVLANARSKRL